MPSPWHLPISPEKERREKLMRDPAFKKWLGRSDSRAAAILQADAYADTLAPESDSEDALDSATSFADVDASDLLVDGPDDD
jgi:hypothetical protein